MRDRKIDPGLYLDLGRDQLGYQLAAADAIQAKTGTWFAVGSTLMGLLVALIAFRHPLSGSAVRLALVATIPYLVMTAVTVPALFASNWRVGPNLDDLERDRRAAGWTELQTRWSAVRRLRDDWNHNEGPYDKRLGRMRVVAVSLACQTLLLVCLAGILIHG